MSGPILVQADRLSGTEPDRNSPKHDRADWLGILSRAKPEDIATLAATEIDAVAFEWLRRPHLGLVMVRGRAGGTGQVFNLGEMTVTRASVRLADGSVGHGYAQGRAKCQAGHAALLDALLQNYDKRPALMERVIEPLRRIEAERRLGKSRKAAATKVAFFTMARGENPE